ncbi:MAG: hypothetical protein P4N60_01720 [Verrucomicrobiae bacterium]|nr:hypothetical protein [Verrucomicrobiae bacterium]
MITKFQNRAMSPLHEISKFGKRLFSDAVLPLELAIFDPQFSILAPSTPQSCSPPKKAV